DRFDLSPFWKPEATPVHATVVGLIAPINQAEPYWLGLIDFFDPHSTQWDTLELFVAEGTLLDAVTTYLPTMSSDFWAMAYINTKKINPQNADQIRLSIQGLDRQLTSNIERTTTRTD